ncbi:MAG: MG2 domain-containing protein, partial [Bacteroidales bacterium]|nr:MG2 domain-containing protein [Bacteroidales bacterium]
VLHNYQNLGNFHKNDTAVSLWVRLWLYDYCLTQGHQEDAFEQAMISLAKEYEKTHGIWLVYTRLGDYYVSRADSKAGQTNDYATAIQWYEKAVEADASNKYGYSERCRNQISEIKKVQVDMTSSYIMAPGKPLCNLRTRNCDKVYLYAVRMSESTYNGNSSVTMDIAAQSVVPITSKRPYGQDTTLAMLPELPIGGYALIANDKPITEKTINRKYFNTLTTKYIIVTQMAFMYFEENNEFQIYVLDRETGAPMPNVKVTLKQQERYNSAKVVKSSGITNNSGFVKLKHDPNWNYSLDLSRGKDVLKDLGIYNYYHDSYHTDDIVIKSFTDRNIYRPGQTVQWKAIIMKNEEYRSTLISGETIYVMLKDANWQTIATDTLTSNEFGSIGGEFTLPTSGALGNYGICCQRTKDHQYSTIYFKVEEYKRPTFEITVKQPEGSYRSGETVNVTGNATALAGYPVQNAKATYHVVRKVFFPFRYYCYWDMPPTSQEEIAHGECVTDDDGNFNFDFTALADDNLKSYWPAYTYQVSVTVTDMAGETHEGSTSITVCDKALRFDVAFPQWIQTDYDDLTFPLKTVNMSGSPQSAQVTCRIVRLNMPEHLLLKSPFENSNVPNEIEKTFPYYAFHGEENMYNWSEAELVLTKKLTTSDNSKLDLSEIKNYKPGAYKITLSTIDTFGQKVEDVFYTCISQNEKKSFPLYKVLYVNSQQKTAEVGETVSFNVASYLDNAHVLVNIFSNNKLVEEKWITLNHSSTTFSYQVEEGQQGRYVCRAYLFYHGNNYYAGKSVSIPFSNKKIEVEFITFRDKLQPGERTTFKIRLSDNYLKPLNQAELLCTMYDASLDELWGSHHFTISTHNTNYPSTPDNKRFELNNLTSWANFFHSNYYHFFPKEFPRWKYVPMYYYGYRYAYGAGMKQKIAMSEVIEIEDFEEEDEVFADYDSALAPVELSFSLDNTTTIQGIKSNKSAGYIAEPNTYEWKESDHEDVVLRTNFAETAFFYPFLRTNENGEVEIEFTIPESLTKWKMLGLAHTLDLRVGDFEKILQTQKELMVVSNAPRFVYENDHLNFSAKVVNMSENALHGTAKLQIFNTETNEEILTKTVMLTLAAKSTAPVEFPVDVPMGVTALTYRISAKTTNNEGITLSDGEENTLPVLSRRMIVSESVPIFITKAGSKTFSLDRLRQNRDSLISCTMQFTPTPKWNVVLALPYLSEYPYECNEQTFSKLYANSLSTFIIKNNPNIETLLTDCQQNHPEALQSKLRQNEALTQTLLAETPWVREAFSQEANIQDIFCLFDQKRVTEETKLMVHKLEKGQNSDGGWPWFAGGRSSSYITEHLLIGAGRLVQSGICKEGDNFLKKSTLHNAVKFVDGETERTYQKMKKENSEWLKNYEIHSSDLHFLYARSFYQDVKNNSESYKFYLQKLYEQAEKLPTFYQKTLAALTLYQLNTTESKALAKKLMLYVKKYAQHSEELGMFWKKEGYGFYWDDAIVERQALMMEAFNVILNDQESVKEMEVWLLQQRRTNHWETTRATADACYAIMGTPENASDVQHATISVKMCGETFTYADTLQIPETRDVAACMENSSGDVVVSRSNNGLAYGGVYYRYYADIDSVTTTGTKIPLSVERQLFKVEVDKRGEKLTLVSKKNPLQVGDKVRVRMEIRADRDMEFVHLKDLRAAAFEPTEAISGYRWQDGLGYYQSFRDASVNFFFDNLNRGTYVFEYTMFVTQSGTYSSGYASIQCMYAPEFNAHSANNGKIVIGKKE